MELEQHMSLLQQQGIISGWHHRKTPVGAEKSATSNDYLSSADFILLLISPAFLASDVMLAEAQLALQRHDAGQAYAKHLMHGEKTLLTPPRRSVIPIENRYHAASRSYAHHVFLSINSLLLLPLPLDAFQAVKI
jgi:hypothetical protein